MATTADFKVGMAIRFNNDIYAIADFQHFQPGRGSAYVRTKLKSLTNGKVLDNTFPGSAKVDEIRIERRKYQYLYTEGEHFVFMDLETFDQAHVPQSQVPNHEFMLPNMDCNVVRQADDGLILSVELPSQVVMEVTYTEPGLSGDTAKNTLKPATVETGAEVRVPLFVNIGDKIKIDTQTGEYLERAK